MNDIGKRDEPRQKLLWLQLHEKEISALAKKLDASVAPHNLSPEEIDSFMKEAKAYRRSNKNG